MAEDTPTTTETIDPAQALDRLHDAMRAERVPNPLATAINIAVQSLRIRFGRSMITIGGIFFAIAFLVSVLSSSVVEIATAGIQEGAEASAYSAEVGIGPMLNLLGKEPRQAWLVTMSLVVCVIGIANAMLMSVTERYQEIGTMKCLGALDIFVVELFLLESGLQGLLGSLSGAIGGTVLILLGTVVGQGFEAVSLIPWAQIALNVALGTVIGVLLTLLGASFPAYRASQMPPAEAMRTEV